MVAEERAGLNHSVECPLGGRDIVICEAKLKFKPELIGQALVYRRLAIRAGASVRDVVISAPSGDELLSEVATELGLTVVIAPVTS